MKEQNNNEPNDLLKELYAIESNTPPLVSKKKKAPLKQNKKPKNDNL